MFKQGLEHYRQGRLEGATAAWQRALRKFEEAHDRQSSAQTLGNLGAALKDQGRYAQSLDHHRRALAILENLGDRSLQATVLINLGNTYERLGEYFKAEGAFRTALNTVRALGDSAGEALVRSNLGGIHAKTGAYEKAIPHYQESAAIAKRIKDPSGIAYALNNLGSAHHAQGHLRKALRYYTESLVLAREVRDARLQAEILINLGTAEEDPRHFTIAIRHHRDALDLASKLGDRRLQAVALNNLGHTYFSAHDLARAEQSLRQAVALYDSLRPGLANIAKISIFDTQVLTYNLLQQILVVQKKYDVALEVAEQGRARVFAEQLAQRVASGSVPTISPPSIKQIEQIAREHRATLVEYSLIPEDAFKVQGKLRGRAGTLYIWVVQPGGAIGFRSLDLTTKNVALSDFVGQMRTTLGLRGRGGSATDNPTVADDDRPLRELHEVLIEPIVDLLPTDPAARVVFIPHETLFLVPFPALEDNSGRHLVDRHTILTAPSIQLLDLTRQRRKRILSKSLGRALVVGNPSPMPKILAYPDEPPMQLDPLLGSEREAIDVAKILNTEPVINAKATKASVISRMAKARIIHLATHGILDDIPGNDMPGAIALAPSGSDDGLLTAEEIVNMAFETELVVLSACDTGRGHISGDGVIGLSRSVIIAGAPSVIVSLWKVPDAATSVLMTRFYEYLSHGRDKAAALRQAMLDTKQSYPKPRDWAAFTLVGEA
ncbi:MAG: CHAT domain-containing protein [Gammaproteobacteria bacterium]